MLALRVLGGKGVRLVLGEIRAGEEGDEATFRVDDGELALLGVAKDVVCLGKGDTLRSRDNFAGRKRRYA